MQKIASFLSTGAYHYLYITSVGEDWEIVLRLMRMTPIMRTARAMAATAMRMTRHRRGCALHRRRAIKNLGLRDHSNLGSGKGLMIMASESNSAFKRLGDH